MKEIRTELKSEFSFLNHRVIWALIAENLQDSVIQSNKSVTTLIEVQPDCPSDLIS